MKTPSTDLFQLIRSLSQTEKRYFRLFAGMQSGDKNYVRLFNAIAQQEYYREDEIRRIFKGEPFLKHFTAAKRYLFELITKSLRNYHAGDYLEFQIKDNIKNIRIFYEKGLFPLCHKLIQKTKKLAIRQEDFTSHIEILKWEAQLMKAKMLIGISKKQIGEFCEEVSGIVNKTGNWWEYSNLLLMTQYEFVKIGMPKQETNLSPFHDLFNHPLLNDERKAVSKKAKIIYRSIHRIFTLLKWDFISHHKHTAKMLELIESDREMKKEEPDQYALFLRLMISAALYLDNYKEALVYIEKLKSFDPKSRKLRQDGFDAAMLFELEVYYNTAQFQKALRLIRFNDKRSLFISNPVNKLNYLISSALIYFILEDFHASLRYVNEAMAIEKEGIRTDLSALLRIFSLMIHIELGNYELLEYSERSTKRFLEKEDYFHKYEKRILGFIRNEIPAFRSNADRVSAYKKLKADIESLSDKKTSEGKSLPVRLNVLSWFDSKIQNRRYLDILKENFETNGSVN